MKSSTSSDFRRDLADLPSRVKRQAIEAYRLFNTDPNHPSLKFKKLPPFEDIWSVRINADYRAIGRWHGNTIVWFFIGSHADYNKMLAKIW